MTFLVEQLDVLPLSKGAKELLPEYVKFLRGPASAKALVGVSQVFRDLLTLKGFQGFPEDAYKFSQLAEELVASEGAFKGEICHIRANRDVKVSTALRSVISTYPAYTLLYYRTVDNPKVLQRLQQALLAAIHSTDRKKNTIKPSDFISYGLAVRQLTEVEAGQRWLRDADEHDLRSLTNVRDVFEGLPKILIDEYTSEHVDGLSQKVFEGTDVRFQRLLKQIKDSHLLLDAATGRYVTRRIVPAKRIGELRKSLGVRGRSAVGPSELCEVQVLGDVDDDTEYPAVYSVVKALGDPAAQEELQALGVEPEESVEPYEFIFVRHQSIPAYAQAFNEALRARGAAKRIELQNQFLPLSTQRLNDQDLIRFSRLLKQLDTDGDYDIALLLRVIFATSSPLERARDLQIVSSDKFTPGPDVLGYDLSRQQWLMPAYPLELKTTYKQEADGYCRKTESTFVVLPDHLQFYKRLTDRFGGEIPEYPFKNLRQPEKLLRKRLSEVDARLTLSRVERCLTLMVACKYEATQATYLFGNYLSSSSARLYYTGLSIEHYQALYGDVCSEVLKIVTGRQGKATSGSKGENPQGYIGGRYCPYVSHVQVALRLMREEISKLQKDLIDKPGTWIELHNQYTAYVIYAQGLLTGIRSVESPFIGPDEMLKDLNVAVFRDKDSDDRFHTRTIPLHPKAVGLADSYERHRNTVLVRLSALNSESALELYGVTYDSPPFVFLLGKDGSWESVRPSRLKKWLEGFTPLPLNSNRKLIRNYLLEEGISVHAVDTLLGHANRGEPHWGAYATRSFRDLEKEILEGLEKLSNEVGILVDSGLRV